MVWVISGQAPACVTERSSGVVASSGHPGNDETFSRVLARYVREKTIALMGRAAEAEPKLRAEWTLASGSSEPEGN